MEFDDRSKRIVFIIFYTMLTTLLVLNAINSKVLVDIFYTVIFVCIYLKYIFITISS